MNQKDLWQHNFHLKLRSSKQDWPHLKIINQSWGFLFIDLQYNIDQFLRYNYFRYILYFFHSWEFTFDEIPGASSIAVEFKSSPRQKCPTISFGTAANLVSVINGFKSVFNCKKPSVNWILQVKIISLSIIQVF